ncbi:MutS protein homolog 5 [Caenorhabditis elegans]|uniref:MutS protein homolog 5 n=2 Tax=Caenorhabditis elegans TaxID=6239 RepID=MSH5_CAEEL|nr:MutS protein homolog 5 [Caenorhabditis elegans]Q19272.2 RecName: Full=MutS protein homolog 5 [Caenorhabditis elegans]AAF76200.1 MSH-5 [Caenorhabditis elegans]CAA98059.2 MutS protein homolog 5 [Caenorhabditis elegans]|eukprot:NP_502531.1 MutS protein homolog 5 [Caenorhabditis elegans]
MSTRWRYYNSKRGNGFRGRGRGRGRGTSLTAVALPRDDNFHKGAQDGAYFKDMPMDPEQFRDETVLSLSFAQGMLGAAYYEQSSQLLKIMNDISEDLEFRFLKRLIDDVKPTLIIANRSQDLEFIKFLTTRYDPQEKIYEDGTTEEGTSEDTVPTWDSSLAYSTDETTAEKEEKEEDEDDDDEGLPAKLNKLPNNFFRMSRAIERLKAMAGSHDSSMTEEDKYIIIKMRFDIEAVNMIRSFGALLLFLDETRMGVTDDPLSVTSPIKSIKTFTLGNLVEIDFNTIQALDILPKETENKKTFGQGRSLYQLMDKCRSTVGKKCLRKWFRNPTTDRDDLVSRQKCVHYFKQDWNAEVTAKLSSILGRVKALNSVFQKFQSGTAQLIHWECFVSTVNALVEILNIIRQTPISKEFPVESDLLREVSEIAVIAGSIINFAESKIQGRVTVMNGIDEELDEIRDTYENMPMVLTAIAKQEEARLGLPPYSNVACVYIPLVGFVLSVPRDYGVESQPDMTLLYSTHEDLRVRNATTSRLDDEFGDILMRLIDSQTAIILTLKTRVMKKKRSIIKLLSIASRIDVLISFGLIAAQNGWNCPALVDEPVIEAVELYHPISVLVVKKSFVPNQVSSGRDGIKASIITGPNACGKSVYMKSIGIMVFLSHIGSFVPARHAKIGIVDRIVTRMFTVDSVLDGMSTFAKDVEQVALALRKATGNSLVIIDEFGKGTMTEVGLSLLASVMTYWMNRGADRCPHIFLSSHFHALPNYIPLETNIATFLTFTVLREAGGKIKYLFRMTPGLVDCSFALSVAKEEGIPPPVIGRACRIYKALKAGTLLKEIKAEVSNDNEKQLVEDMDVVLADEDGFMAAVESFVKRKKTSFCESSMRNVSEEIEKERSEASTPASKSRSTITARSNSVLSSRSMASVDQLSVLDALLPKKKKKKVTGSSMESSMSPDPFQEEDEGTEGEEDQISAPVSRPTLPSVQKYASEEEKQQSINSRHSFSTRTAIHIPTPIQMGEAGGVKRPRSTSTSSPGPSASKSVRTEVFKKTPNVKESQVLETPKQLSISSFLEPKFPSSEKDVISRVSERYLQSDPFKTPISDRRSQQSSRHSTPKNRSMNQSLIQSARDTPHETIRSSNEVNPEFFNIFNFPDDSILKSQDTYDPNVTPRSSSRRELRPDVSHSQNSQFGEVFSELGTQFSIFNSQQSFPGNSMGTTNPDCSIFDDFFANSQDGEKKIDSTKTSMPIVNSDNFIFKTPEPRSSEKQRSLLKNKGQASNSSISPSSLILGQLAFGDVDQTPRPRGDNPIEFQYDVVDDDDPIFEEKNCSAPVFEFLKSNDDEEDDEFLKSFLETEGSLHIDTSADETIDRSKRS